MDEILLRSKNPNDIRLEELEPLREALSRCVPDAAVKVQGQEQVQGHYGVTWFQILQISIPAAVLVAGKVAGKLADKVADEIAQIAIQWAKNRFKKKSSRRPVYIPIYGPDGKVLKSVVVKNADDEPEDRTEQDRALQSSDKKPKD